MPENSKARGVAVGGGLVISVGAAISALSMALGLGRDIGRMDQQIKGLETAIQSTQLMEIDRLRTDVGVAETNLSALRDRVSFIEGKLEAQGVLPEREPHRLEP